MARHFTVDEAQDQLRVVEPIIEDAVRLRRRLDDVVRRAGKEPSEADSESTVPPDLVEQLSELRKDLRNRLEFLHGLGVQVKDLRYGLIDFPTMRDGKEVLLCWRLGEDAIRYWHTYEDGFPGRRRL